MYCSICWNLKFQVFSTFGSPFLVLMRQVGIVTALHLLTQFKTSKWSQVPVPRPNVYLCSGWYSWSCKRKDAGETWGQWQGAVEWKFKETNRSYVYHNFKGVGQVQSGFCAAREASLCGGRRQSDQHQGLHRYLIEHNCSPDIWRRSHCRSSAEWRCNRMGLSRPVDPGLASNTQTRSKFLCIFFCLPYFYRRTRGRGTPTWRSRSRSITEPCAILWNPFECESKGPKTSESFRLEMVKKITLCHSRWMRSALFLFWTVQSAFSCFRAA